jgi:hypothetical protein
MKRTGYYLYKKGDRNKLINRIVKCGLNGNNEIGYLGDYRKVEGDTKNIYHLFIAEGVGIECSEDSKLITITTEDKSRDIIKLLYQLTSIPENKFILAR